MKILMLDDNEYYREWLEGEILKLQKNWDVSGKKTDAIFLDEATPLLKKTNDISNIGFILDLDLNQISNRWCKSKEELKDAQNFGEVIHNDRRIHGYNVCLFLRSMSKDVKIAIVSSHSYSNFEFYSGIKDPVSKDPNLVFLPRGNAKNDAIDLVNFFKPTQ